jgi:hypothetical protein
MMGDARSTASSYFGVPLRLPGTSASFTGVSDSPVTPELVVQCARETGIHFCANIGNVTPFDVLDLVDGLNVQSREEQAPDGSTHRTTVIRTPEGDISEVFVTPPYRPVYWAEHLVKSDKDLHALTALIEGASRITREDPLASARITEAFRQEAEKWPDWVPLTVTVGVPAFGITCSLYMDPETAFYMLADQPAAMECLFELEALRNDIIVDCAAAAGADFVFGAINGLELYSPRIYSDYFVPQARALHEAAHRHGMRGWVHTCGHMNRLIEMGVYSEMGVDVLESLSHPPLGDISRLGKARADLGPNLITRGAVNVGLFYSADLWLIRRRARLVLEECRGFRHMIGDTNDSYPPYPRDAILALVDEVHKEGRLLLADTVGIEGQRRQA